MHVLAATDICNNVSRGILKYGETVGIVGNSRQAIVKRKWRQLCKPFALLPWTPDVLWQYGEIYRYLKTNGTLIGTNDLWIAATAVVHGMPLITNNPEDFRRIPDLAVLPF